MSLLPKRWQRAVLLSAAWLCCCGALEAARVHIAVGSCVLEAPAELEGVLEALAEDARVALPELYRELGVSPRAPYRIFLIPRGTMRDSELARLDAFAPPWASGFLVPRSRVGGIRLALVETYPYQGLLSVLVHESAHMALHDASAGKLPRWFDEGVASWVERRWAWRDAVVLSSSLLARDLPSLDSLDRAFGHSRGSARLAYAASFDFVAWGVRRNGAQLIPSILAQLPEASFSQAWKEVTGLSLLDAEAQWRRRRIWVSRWLPLLTGSSTLWLGITILAVVAAQRRRRRARELMEAWAAEEAWEQSKSGWAN